MNNLRQYPQRQRYVHVYDSPIVSKQSVIKLCYDARTSLSGTPIELSMDSL